MLFYFFYSQCKSRVTRNAALNLLLVLVKASPELYKIVSDALAAHHTMGETRSNWQYLPSAMEKDACGYVGLKNLGATCYMNSLMQNLYMQPEFREGILRRFGGGKEVEKVEKVSFNILFQ